jgi:hypothetical protein
MIMLADAIIVNIRSRKQTYYDCMNHNWDVKIISYSVFNRFETFESKRIANFEAA